MNSTCCEDCSGEALGCGTTGRGSHQRTIRFCLAPSTRSLALSHFVIRAQRSRRLVFVLPSAQIRCVFKSSPSATGVELDGARGPMLPHPPPPASALAAGPHRLLIPPHAALTSAKLFDVVESRAGRGLSVRHASLRLGQNPSCFDAEPTVLHALAPLNCCVIILLRVGL